MKIDIELNDLDVDESYVGYVFSVETAPILTRPMSSEETTERLNMINLNNVVLDARVLEVGVNRIKLNVKGRPGYITLLSEGLAVLKPRNIRGFIVLDVHLKPEASTRALELGISNERINYE